MPFIIEDDLNVPKETKSIDYFGPDPFRIYSRIPPLLQIIFQARGVHLYEEDFRWDNSGDPMNFFFLFKLERHLDKLTTPIVKVRVFGHQPKDPSAPTGRMKIEVIGTMRTIYPIEGWFGKAIFWPFLWIYHYLIYNQVRRRYMLMTNTRIERLMNELRAILGIMVKPRLK